MASWPTPSLRWPFATDLPARRTTSGCPAVWLVLEAVLDEDDWSISQRAAFHALRLRKEAQSPLVAGTVFGPHCGIICGWLCAGIDQITEALNRIQRMEIFTA